MATLNFKYGANYAKLPSTITDGTIYVTTAEKAMYVDLDGARHRLGQIIVYSTWADFNANTTLPPQSPDAFYYILDQNMFLAYDSANNKWKQINSTSALESTVSALTTRVSAVETKATNNATNIATNAAAITQEVTDRKAADEAVTAAYKAADAKLQTSIDGLATRMTTAEGEIDTLQSDVAAIKTDYATNASVTEKVSNLQGQITTNKNSISGLTTRMTTAEGEIDTLQSDIEDINESIETINTNIAGINADISKNYATKTELNSVKTNLQGQIDSNDTDITALQGRMTTAESNINSLTTKHNSLESTVSSQGTSISNLEAKVSTNATNIKTNADAIAVLNGSSSTEGSVAYQIAQIVAGADESFDTLKEIADWISSHSSDATAMNSAISANTTAISILNGGASTSGSVANSIQTALTWGTF